MAMAAPSSVSRAPVKTPSKSTTPATPDLSWFCCFCCSRRPMPEASFCMLLTTCSHIVCSSCWGTSRGPTGDCPACGVHANTLNLTTTRPTPKQLEPYFTSPVKLITNLLSACQFQEHQKRQSLSRRKKAWVLINHSRAKEDYEREYAECKKVLQEQNQKKKALRTVVEMLHKRGIDPFLEQKGTFSESVLEAVIRSITPRNAVPSTPFFTNTPLVGLPVSTSTPTVPGTNTPGVEFSEPKKLPHTMRGSVTSLTVRRSPSNPPTPLSQLKKPLTHSGTPSNIPAKRPRMMTTPVVNSTPSRQRNMSTQLVSVGPQPMGGGRLQGQTPVNVTHPIQQSRYGTSQALNAVRSTPTVPVGPAEMSAKMQSLTLRRQGSHQQPSIGQFYQPMVQSGRPTPQSVRPNPQSGQPVQQYSRPNPQSSQPVQQYSRPNPQSSQPVQQYSRPNPQSSQPVQQDSHPNPQSGQHVQQYSRPNPQSGHPVQQYSPQSSQPVQQYSHPNPQSGQHVQQYSCPNPQPVQQYSHPNPQSGQHVQQYSRPNPQSGQPVQQYSHPNPQSGQPVQQYIGQPIQKSVPSYGRPTPQSGRQQLGTQTPSHYHTPQHYSQPQRVISGESACRVRAVPPSSTTSTRIFPSPTPSHNSQRSQGSSNSSRSQHPHTHTPSVTNLPGPRTTPGITIGPPPSLKPLSQAVAQFQSSWSQPRSSSSSPGRGRTKTPNNPSPLLTSFATPSPWQQGRRSQGSSPWQQHHTSLPGAKLRGSVGSGRKPRLTPVKT